MLEAFLDAAGREAGRPASVCVVPVDAGGRRHARRPPSVRVVTYSLVAALVVLLVASAALVALTRYDVSRAEGQLRSALLPAQTTAATLGTAYIDEETGQRGYLLSGQERFLQSYVQRQATAAALERKLHSLLAGDPQALAQLERVIGAYDRWQTLAEAQVAVRRAGPVPAAELTAMAEQGKTRFGTVRRELVALQERTSALANAELDRIASANVTANVAALVTVALALAVALLAFPALRRVLTVPLRRLLERVQRVAGGAYEEAIPPDGPAELATIADAVERMRQSILRNTSDLVAARHELTLRDERDRIAADLHDFTIQRVFALGLSMSAAASQSHELAVALTPLIEETDLIIRELRRIIFDVSHHAAGSLRAGVGELVGESARALGFTPTVAVDGPVDRVGREVREELLAVLHEALSNVARHAQASAVEVRVATDGEILSLSVSDDGRGMPAAPAQGRGLRNMEARAARLAGGVSVRSEPGRGTTVEWRVPLERPVAATPTPPAPTPTTRRSPATPTSPAQAPPAQVPLALEASPSRKARSEPA